MVLFCIFEYGVIYSRLLSEKNKVISSKYSTILFFKNGMYEYVYFERYLENYLLKCYFFYRYDLN